MSPNGLETEPREKVGLLGLRQMFAEGGEPFSYAGRWGGPSRTMHDSSVPRPLPRKSRALSTYGEIPPARGVIEFFCIGSKRRRSSIRRTLLVVEFARSIQAPIVLVRGHLDPYRA